MLQQPWISAAVKVRLIEYIRRLTLAAYVGCGSSDLLLKEIVDYTPRFKDKADDPWEELVPRAINVEYDGHAAKFVRDLMHGQKLSAKYEDNPTFMVKGDMWLKICHMCKFVGSFFECKY
jgi:hypothetical protein